MTKSIFWWCLCLVLPVCVKAQAGFTISGHITNLPDSSKIYITRVLPGQLKNTDSTTSFGGKFVFKGKADGLPQQYVLIKKGKFYPLASFYLENGNIVINGSYELDGFATGTPTNDHFTAYLKEITPVRNLHYNLFMNMKMGKTKDFLNDKDYKLLLGILDEQIERLVEKHIKLNHQSVLALRILKEREQFMSVEDLSRALSLIDASTFYKNAEYQGYKTRLEDMRRVSSYAFAPDFELPDADGKLISLKAMRGKYVLIDFWASWCAPCRSENPNVMAGYHQYKSKGFEVLGVSLDKDKGKWLKAAADDHLDYTNLIDTDGKTAKLYAVLGIPQNYLIDPEGKIIASGLKGENLRNKLAEIFENPTK